jgi:SAM-dependent methyltransferase
MTNPRTDKEILTKQAYANDEHLAVRYRTHELYSEPKIDFQKWVMDTFEWRGDEWVLDVGSGSGSYFELLQSRVADGCLVAGDLSFGMAQQARNNPDSGGIHILNLDAQHLPFADGTFDIILANHMLYHVPDLDLALTEIRRVLRPDGTLLAATNSEHTMPEFDTLIRRACTLLGYPKQELNPAHVQFSLESGAGMLGQYFRAVARYDLPSAFHFPETEPVIAYLNSMRPLRETLLPEDISWDNFMEVMEKQISRLIRHFGELQVHKLTGVLIATNGGGFARDFLAHMDQEV